jgi:hypothetical protein
MTDRITTAVSGRDLVLCHKWLEAQGVRNGPCAIASLTREHKDALHEPLN